MHKSAIITTHLTELHRGVHGYIQVDTISIPKSQHETKVSFRVNSYALLVSVKTTISPPHCVSKKSGHLRNVQRPQQT